SRRLNSHAIVSARTISPIRSIAERWLSAASRVASSPRAETRRLYRSSITHARWAVVYSVSPLATLSLASSTTTDFPSDASRYAVVSPAMPPPITHTSYLVFPASGAATRVEFSTDQGELVAEVMAVSD